MTSIFSASWMCRLCGREACADCFYQVKELTDDQPGASHADVAALQSRREKHSHANPFFLTCTRRAEHKSTEFSPMSRFCKADLAEAIKDMEELLARTEEDEDIVADDGGAELQAGAFVPTTPPLLPAPAAESSSLAGAIIPPEERPPALETPSNESDIPAHPTRLYENETITEERFRRVWARGEPLVVAGMLTKFDIEWTPEYFKERYGDQSCLIYDCQAEKEKSIRTTVGAFFEGFGKYENREKIWKLKVGPSGH